MSSSPAHPQLPYRLAVLCYLYDDADSVLLLHRRQEPNIGMYSPVGGKVDLASGEGPHDCAVREIREETGISLSRDEVGMIGIVSERAYEGQAHWLIFLFKVMRPVRRDELRWSEFSEGRLEWKRIDEVAGLAIPHTDRTVMWPLVQAYRGGFFVVHIDCSVEPMQWTLCEARKPGAGADSS